MGLFDRFKKDKEEEKNQNAIITDKEEALYKIETQHPIAVIPKLSDDLKKDRDIALACVSRYELALNSFPAFNNDVEVVLAGMRNSFRCIKYASPILQHNSRIVGIGLADYLENLAGRESEFNTEQEYKDAVKQWAEKVFDMAMGDRAKQFELGIQCDYKAAKDAFYDKVMNNTKATLDKMREAEKNKQDKLKQIQDM